MSKLVKESLEEKPQWYQGLSKWAKAFVDYEEIEPEIDEDEVLWDIAAWDLALFVDENWGEITGLSNRDKDEEQDFPDEVSSLMDEFDVGYDDFSYAWGDVREGSEDWEEEEDMGECIDCGEEFPEDDMFEYPEGLVCDDCYDQRDE